MVGIQSPIPLIYLCAVALGLGEGWDSVTYPLDILARSARSSSAVLGFSHLSP